MAEYIGYQIEVEMEGVEFTIHPSELEITLRDSIHSFYSSAAFSVQDVTGIFTEHGAFKNGVPYRIKLGRSNQEPAYNSYVVSHSSIDDVATPGFISGEVTANMVHQFLSLQGKESSAFDGEISGFVEQLVADGDFEELLIEPTAYSRIWYRPLWSQEETIRMLCRKAYSTNSEGTPFYCFTDSKNRFHFESYETLFGKSPVKDYVFRPESEEGYSNNTVYTMLPVSPKYSSSWDSWHHAQYWMTPEGEIQEDVRTLMDITSAEGNVPFLGQAELPTSYDFEWTEKDEPNRESRIAQNFKNGLFLDKYIIRVPLDSEAVAGETVNITTLYYSENGRETSPATSGKYLIESSKHEWVGKRQTAYSELLVSRPRIVYPSGYLIGGRTFGA